MQQSEKDVLRERIDNLLLVQRAKELNINVDSEVTKSSARSSSTTRSPIRKSSNSDPRADQHDL